MLLSSDLDQRVQIVDPKSLHYKRVGILRNFYPARAIALVEFSHRHGTTELIEELELPSNVVERLGDWEISRVDGVFTSYKDWNGRPPHCICFTVGYYLPRSRPRLRTNDHRPSQG